MAQKPNGRGKVNMCEHPKQNFKPNNVLGGLDHLKKLTRILSKEIKSHKGSMEYTCGLGWHRLCDTAAGDEIIQDLSKA